MGVEFNRTQETINKMEMLVDEALKEIGKTGNIDLVANSPVHKIKPGEKYKGVPGTLKRGHSYKVTSNSKTKKVTFGNYVYYAPYVEFKEKGKGGNPWFRETLREDREKFLQIVKKHLKKVEEV